MPTYDYLCLTCNETFEMLQSFSDDPLTRCPGKSKGISPEGCVSPGKGRVEKQLSAPAIIFKGQGFYKTDSKADSIRSTDTKKEEAKAEKSTEKNTKEKAEGKTKGKEAKAKTGEAKKPEKAANS